MTPRHIRVVLRDVAGRLAVCAVLLASATGQKSGAPGQEIQRDAMKKFAFMVGKWSGDARWFTNDGIIELIQTEDVHYEQNGLMLRVDERSQRKSDRRQIGQSFVVISYDEQLATYRVHEYFTHQEGNLKIDDDWRGMTVDFVQPKLTTRMVLRLNEADYWSETHWLTADSETPRIFLVAAVRRQQQVHLRERGSKDAGSAK